MEQAQKKTQKNIRDVKTKKSNKGFDGAGTVSIELQSEVEKESDFRQPIEITVYSNPSKFLKTKNIKKDKETYNYTRILGAAGEQLIPTRNLKVISDHYSSDTRTAFSDLILLDPVAAPASTFRVGAIFEDGFELRLTLASQFDATLGRELTSEEIQARLSKETVYNDALMKLSTWKNDKDIEQVAKDLEGVSLAQGKAVAQIIPGILELPQQKLPIACEIVDADDVGEPIVDAGMTKKLIAIKIKVDDEDQDDENVKDILRADEMVYLVRGPRGLKRGAKWHGVSPMEPVLQISKAIKTYYQLHAPLVMVAAYVTKQLLKIKGDAFDANLQSRVQDFMTKLYKATTWAIAMPEWYDSMDTVEPKVNWQMFDGIEQKLAAVELAQLGVPKSSQNREQDLNRDIATIQAIQFVRFVRNPSEGLIKRALEKQLFNPLFAHLLGKPLGEIPVRVEIVRKTPKGGDIDKLYDNMSVDKNNDISSGNLMQNQAQSNLQPLGASGTLEKLQIKTYTTLLKKIQNENQ